MEQNRRNSAQQNRSTNRRPKRKAPKSKGLGIGTFIYFFIFLYLIYNIISFLISNDVNYVSAEKGSIYNDELFEGIILRNETVVKSTSNGMASYYVPEGDKINIDSIVCMIDSNGNYTAEIKKDLNYINDKLAYANNCNSHEDINKNLYTYTMNYDNDTFGNIYEFKNNMKDTVSNITQSLYIHDQLDLDTIRSKELLESQINNNISIIKAMKSGVISYRIDGYENFSIDNLDIQSLFDFKSEEEIYTYKQETIKKDSPLFKIIDNDKWYVVCEMKDDLTDFIQGKDNISINIIEKDVTIKTKVYDIVQKNKKEYLILEIDRYFDLIKNRKIKFRVVYEQYDGIKIPKTAVAEKEFIRIPKSCIAKKGNNEGVLKKTYGENFVGGESVEFIKIGFKHIEEESYYVPISEEGLQLNDILVDSTNNNYTISEKKSLKGVYIINKGYTNFKLIDEIYSADSYIIVETNTPYGIRIYDRVIADASNAKEDVILY
ncbi:HlyD family efflux transporter periplasmic adaptor subunit [Vallitalea guaymasensis]|uniref:HlyD family efflux transporter periplasmic adaptor subunit n=1 Tax=Vallitalea guaymasensis TaxID=1185412 RepID=UPI000DE3BA0F|nr:HlyD family efflux transporter periplasmic adaptor subunit [Vallitalea guaymasensis]